MLTDDEFERFMSFVYFEPNTGCWLHAGSPMGEEKNQYSGFHLRGKYRKAHRVSYEHFNGKLVKGLVVDHRCRQTFCVNPDHLEQVTHRVNVKRGLIGDLRHLWDRPKKKPKSHCRNGHALTDDNVKVNMRGARECTICRRESANKYNEKKRIERGPLPDRENPAVIYWREITHCKNGHPFTHHNGRQRRCRVCENEAARRYREMSREKVNENSRRYREREKGR
jgi:hypothetical protein